MTWSPLFNLSSSYKDAVYWNNLTALTDVIVSTVTTGSDSFWSFTPVTPITIDTCPCTLSSRCTEVQRGTLSTQVTMKWNNTQKVFTFQYQVHLQLHCGTKQTKKLRQNKTASSKWNSFLENVWIAFKIRQQLGKKWRYNNRKRKSWEKPSMTNKLQEVLKQLAAGHEITYLCLCVW